MAEAESAQKTQRCGHKLSLSHEVNASLPIQMFWRLGNPFSLNKICVACLRLDGCWTKFRDEETTITDDNLQSVIDQAIDTQRAQYNKFRTGVASSDNTLEKQAAEQVQRVFDQFPKRAISYYNRLHPREDRNVEDPLDADQQDQEVLDDRRGHQTRHRKEREEEVQEEEGQEKVQDPRVNQTISLKRQKTQTAAADGNVVPQNAVVAANGPNVNPPIGASVPETASSITATSLAGQPNGTQQARPAAATTTQRMNAHYGSGKAAAATDTNRPPQQQGPGFAAQASKPSVHLDKPLTQHNTRIDPEAASDSRQSAVASSATTGLRTIVTNLVENFQRGSDEAIGANLKLCASNMSDGEYTRLFKWAVRDRFLEQNIREKERNVDQRRWESAQAENEFHNAENGLLRAETDLRKANAGMDEHREKAIGQILPRRH